ncbi:hypothetical protein Q0F99_18640 [Rathayibacter oskolensis]|uniref:hypothetical protein n=1 Tax=Rathayibacter oskolensis TaxID=1891671 RepID=UPI00265F70C9|nr:hypothetical protein [Rathayibacter oskolensis]WKK71393.1 hypothetical protein Q0F99_18640 [Rathayibacter oskolensis]
MPLPDGDDATAGAWAGIAPPRGGWLRREPVDPAFLERVARDGIDEIAAAVGSETGEQIVSRVRSSVWGRPLDGLEDVPAGAAFALFALGFSIPPILWLCSRAGRGDGSPPSAATCWCAPRPESPGEGPRHSSKVFTMAWAARSR